MQRAFQSLAARLRLAEQICPQAPAAGWTVGAVASLPKTGQHQLFACRWLSSENSANHADSTSEAANPSSSSSTAAGGPSSSGAAPPVPAATTAREPVPSFSSGARLVQPLQRGGPQVQAQEGTVHINCSLNNTFVVLTDLSGQVKTYTSGGSVGFKNAGKSTPLAAERAAAELARRALEKGFYSVNVRLRGMGRNKQIAVQALAAAGVSVTQLQEVTPTPYNGCRLPRKRRV